MLVLPGVDSVFDGILHGIGPPDNGTGGHPSTLIDDLEALIDDGGGANGRDLNKSNFTGFREAIGIIPVNWASHIGISEQMRSWLQSPEDWTTYRRNYFEDSPTLLQNSPIRNKDPPTRNKDPPVRNRDPPTRNLTSFRKMSKMKRGVPGYVNGRRVSALADTGAQETFITAHFAKENGIKVKASSRSFKLGNSTETSSIGKKPHALIRPTSIRS